MLTPEQLDAIPSDIAVLYATLETWLGVEVAKALQDIFDTSVSSQYTAAARALHRKTLLKLLMFRSSLKTAVNSTFDKALKLSLKNDKDRTQSPKFNSKILENSKVIRHIQKKGKSQLFRQLLEINKNIPSTATTALFTAVSDAQMALLNGQKTHTQAVRQAVSKLIKEGIKSRAVAGGRREQIDVVVRRTVLTQMNRAAATCSLIAALQMGFNHVETTAHAGARNTGTGYENHESWQGQIFHISKPGEVVHRMERVF
jgi:hypothetical protein